MGGGSLATLVAEAQTLANKRSGTISCILTRLNSAETLSDRDAQEVEAAILATSRQLLRKGSGDGATDASQVSATLSPRAALDAINAELARGHHTERTRQALLTEREHWQRAMFEQTEQAAEAASRARQAAPPVAGYTAGAHPAPPPGRTWDAPVLDAVAAQLVTREIASADISRWLARGAALAQQEPGEPPALDPALIADARFALKAFLPERTMRAQVERFLEETGLGNDEPFIRELAARGAPLRQELAEARRDRFRLGTLNAGSPEYADTAAALAARYQRIYGAG